MSAYLRTGTAYEHRLVWEAHHGAIPKGGVIHHKNGIASDNRIENLELLPSHGAHVSRHMDQEKASGAIKNCPCCGQEFVAFRLKKYCSVRCRAYTVVKEWRQKHPGHHAQQAKTAYHRKMQNPEYREKMRRRMSLFRLANMNRQKPDQATE